VRFEVQTGKPPSSVDTQIANGTKLAKGAKFKCLVCDQPTEEPHVKQESMAGRMGQQLMAMVAEGDRSRTYLSPHDEHVQIAYSAQHKWAPNEPMDRDSYNLVSGRGYGFFTWSDLFTSRQLASITTFCDLVSEVHKLIKEHSNNDTTYANAVVTYLAFSIDKAANYWSSLCAWHTGAEKMMSTFARQAIPMVWDYTEANPFSKSSGNWLLGVEQAAESIAKAPVNPPLGFVSQLDASQALPFKREGCFITDPPYYDNVAYADLSDFFYVWLRRTLGKQYPDLFSTILTPKNEEIVASHHRFDGDRIKARNHFENGLKKTFGQIYQFIHNQYPFVLYYAYKQAEEQYEIERFTKSSTGWETMLQSLLDTGFQVTGTWPMRTEYVTALKAGINALASSIVIACRPRPSDAPIATRREFLVALRKELPQELKVLMNGRVAPVDFAQAVIGPSMAVFSRYSKVLEADGSTMTVRTALQEINYFLEDFLAQQEGDLDVESQFCIAWFQQYGSKEGLFGEADVLARAKNISVEGLTRMGLVDAPRGKVRLTLREDYEDSWDPQTQSRLTAWEACQRLIWTLNENGEQDAGRLARRLGGLADQARELAYRLYGIADRKGWTEEALGYNALVASWPEIQEAAAQAAEETQGRIM